jgi:hypothetical protein
VRRPRAERYTPHPGGSGIMPAGTTTGARGASLQPRRRVRHAAALSAVFGKPGPTLSLRDESPVGENRSGTPAGERARKRRAAQAAFLRGASRTPLACGQHDLASAGVPLPFICWKRVDKKRFVDETAFAARSELLRGLVVCRQQNSDAKNRAARTRLLSPLPGGERSRA